MTKILDIGINKISEITSKISFFNKTCLVATIFALFSFMWILHPLYRFEYVGYSAFVIMVVIALLCIDKVKCDVRFSKSMLIPLLIFASAYFISGIIFFDTGRMLIAITIGIGTPMYSYVCTRSETHALLFMGTSIGMVFSFNALFLLSLLIDSLSFEQYSSILLNPNGLGAIASFAVPSSIYLIEILSDKYKSIKAYNIFLVLLYLTLGGALFIAIATKSRTTFLSIIFVLIIWIIYNLICKKKSKVKKIKWLALVITIIPLLIFSNIMLCTNVNNEALKAQTKIVESYSRYEESEKKQNAEHNKKMIKYNRENAFYDPFSRLSKGIDDKQSFSSGRFEIWDSVIQNMGWIGHKSGEKFYVDGGKEFLDNPHNMLLDVGYYQGPLAMVSFAAFLLAVFMAFAKKIHENKILRLKTKTLFISMFFVTFMVHGMLSGSYVPYSSCIAFAFWTMIPICEKNERE